MFINTLLLLNFLIAPVESSLDNIPQLKASDSKVTRIYFVRHGESAFNQTDSNGIKYTSGKGISIPLTEKGKKQATVLGRKLC